MSLKNKITAQTISINASRALEEPQFLSLASSNISAITDDGGLPPQQQSFIRRGERPFQWPPHTHYNASPSQSTQSSPGYIDPESPLNPKSSTDTSRYSQWRQRLRPLSTHSFPPDAVGRLRADLTENLPTALAAGITVYDGVPFVSDTVKPGGPLTGRILRHCYQRVHKKSVELPASIPDVLKVIGESFDTKKSQLLEYLQQEWPNVSLSVRFLSSQANRPHEYIDSATTSAFQPLRTAHVSSLQLMLTEWWRNFSETIGRLNNPNFWSSFCT